MTKIRGSFQGYLPSNSWMITCKKMFCTDSNFPNVLMMEDAFSFLCYLEFVQ